MDLEQRLTRLEDDRAIRDLKMRYLRAADAKDPANMRDCFRPDARIRFDGFPNFDNRDDFIAIYEQFGCQDGVFDIHHGGTGILTWRDDGSVDGWWPLYYHNINLTAGSVLQLGVEYADHYVKMDGRWWIGESRSWRKSCVMQKIGDDGLLHNVAIGEAPSVFGEN